METIRLCHIDELDNDSSRGFTVREQAIFAVKKYGQVYAYHNRCPHLGVPLEWLPDRFLDADAALIQCSTHGALFVIESGECVAGPCSGQSLQPLPVEITDNEIFVRLPGLKP